MFVFYFSRRFRIKKYGKRKTNEANEIKNEANRKMIFALKKSKHATMMAFETRILLAGHITWHKLMV